MNQLLDIGSVGGPFPWRGIKSTGAGLVAMLGSDGANPASASNPVPVTASSTPAAVTPRALNNSKILVAGTAIQLVVGPCNGGYIVNGSNAARQGLVAAEPFYVDPVQTCGHTDAAMAAQTTTVALDPGQPFTIPPLAAGQILWGNASTINHVVQGSVW